MMLSNSIAPAALSLNDSVSFDDRDDDVVLAGDDLIDFEAIIEECAD